MIYFRRLAGRAVTHSSLKREVSGLVATSVESHIVVNDSLPLRQFVERSCVVQRNDRWALPTRYRFGAVQGVYKGLFLLLIWKF